MPPRTNRPDGISQSNRTHPFFIILRRYAGDEEKQLVKLTKAFIIYAVFGIVFPIVLWGPIILVFERRLWPCIIAMLLINVCSIIYVYRKWRRMGLGCIFPKVENMIFSNDYRDAQLNVEEVMEMTIQCNGSVKQMELFEAMLRVAPLYQLALSTIIVAIAAIVMQISA